MSKTKPIADALGAEAQDYRDATAFLRSAEVKLHKLIVRASDSGLSYREIAGATGLSVARIGQIMKARRTR